MMSTLSNTLDCIPAIILAGGLGTRLKPVIGEYPKVLAPILGKPFLSYVLDKLSQQKLHRTILCTGYLAEYVQEEYGKSYKGIEIMYSREETPLGTGGAIRHAISKLSASEYLILNGDSFIDIDFQAFFNWYQEHSFPVGMAITTADDCSNYGTIEIRGDRVISFHEKAFHKQPGFINAGIYLVNEELIKNMPSTEPLSLEYEVIPSWVKMGLGAFYVSSLLIDIGTPISYEQAQSYFAQNSWSHEHSLDYE